MAAKELGVATWIWLRGRDSLPLPLKISRKMGVLD
jgi:hypothetical protein